ncbi:MAG: YabP/YqfC family sporulation protein [Lachnospiraceae bacterium]|nr:YabP/YqfC family sporulation protein [Lachnospiraceae bacterium]
MDDKRGHIVQMIDRKLLLVTDVKDVDSFNLSEILLETAQGMMLVKGSNIHVKRLNLEKGEADIEGNFNSIVYTANKKNNESVVKRLFK